MSLLTTIPNVPIITTGRDYPLSTGRVSFTREHLADAVTAANTPGVVAPRLKLGHDDPRFNGGFNSLMNACLEDVSLTRDQYQAVMASAARFEQLFDADPAIGRVTNMRLTDEGHTIVGDLEAVPTWLAEGMEALYPGRSFEGDLLPERVRTDVTTNTGRNFSLVIDGLALLGTTQPAIRTLSDLRTLITGPTEEIPMTERAAASVATNDIIDAYNAIISANPAYSSWWVRESVDSPDGLIVDTGNGLVLVPYMISGDTPSFGDPQPVRRAYVDATDTERVAARAWTTGLKASSAARDASEQTPTEASVDPEQVQIRKDLGLAEDATSEDVSKRIAELNAAGGGDEEKPAGGDNGEGEKPAEDAGEEVAARSAADDLTMRIDKGAYQELRARADRGDEAYNILRGQEVERLLASAMNEDRKIGPGSVDGWRDRFSKDFDGAKADLDSLPSNLIPGAQQVHASAGDTKPEAVNQELLAAARSSLGIKTEA